MSTHINRRNALAAMAAVPAAFAVCAPLSFAEGKSGALATLIRRYFAELEAFQNADSDWLQDDHNFLADQPYDATLRELIGIPAHSADDALCAIEFILREGEGCAIIGGESLYGRVGESLATAIRDYLAGIVAA